MNRSRQQHHRRRRLLTVAGADMVGALWRFRGRFYCVKGPVAFQNAVACSSFARAATGGKLTVVRTVVREPGVRSGVLPAVVISRVPKDAWTIATANGPTASRERHPLRQTPA
jgi:hypothetical protein